MGLVVEERELGVLGVLLLLLRGLGLVIFELEEELMGLVVEERELLVLGVPLVRLRGLELVILMLGFVIFELVE